MVHENIERFIGKRESQLKLGLRLVPYFVWASLPLLMAYCLSYYSIPTSLGILVEGIAACAGITILAGQRLSELDRRKAYLIWMRLRNSGHWHRAEASMSYPLEFENENARRPAQEFGTTIERLLAADPAGRILPLAQAVRLMNTFQRQQYQLRILDRRMTEIGPLRKSICLKMEQLRDLQESSPAGEQSLRDLDADEQAIHALKDQIQASCGRLEIILLTLKNAVRARDLHHEVASLSQRALPQHAGPDSAPDLDRTISLDDIERQITFEIETYLHLERETSRHLN